LGFEPRSFREQVSVQCRQKVAQPLHVPAIFRNFPVKLRIVSSGRERFGAQFHASAEQF
jgi:hypothetical protein